MYALLLRLIYLVLIAFMFMSLFITARDLIRGRNKTALTISVIGLMLIVFIFLFQTSALPILILPLIFMVTTPIFLTDKNRDWDGIDRIYRIVALAAVLSASIMTINAVIR